MVNLSVFISSYGLYNEHGGCCGKWWDVSDHRNLEDFRSEVVEHLATLGDDDPEIMCLDTDDNDLGIYQESGMEWIRAYFDAVEAVENGLDSDQLISVFREVFSSTETKISDAIDMVENEYTATCDSREDYALKSIEEAYPDLPNSITSHIDLLAYAKDMEGGSLTFVESVGGNKLYVFG